MSHLTNNTPPMVESTTGHPEASTKRTLGNDPNGGLNGDRIDKFLLHLLFVDPHAETVVHLASIPGAKCVHVTPSNEQSYSYLISISSPPQILVIRPDEWLRSSCF